MTNTAKADVPLCMAFLVAVYVQALYAYSWIQCDSEYKIHLTGQFSITSTICIESRPWEIELVIIFYFAFSSRQAK